MTSEATPTDQHRSPSMPPLVERARGTTTTFDLLGTPRYIRGTRVDPTVNVDDPYDPVMVALSEMGAIARRPVKAIFETDSRQKHSLVLTFHTPGWTTVIDDGKTFLYDPAGTLRVVRIFCAKLQRAFYNIDTVRSLKYERCEAQH